MHIWRILLWLVTAAIAFGQSGDIFQRLAADLKTSGEGKTAAQALANKNFALLEQILTRARPSEEVSAAELLCLRGSVDFLSGSMEAAAGAFFAAAKLAPLKESDSFTLAMALVKLGDDEKARSVLDGLARSHPEQALYLYWLGRIDYDQRRYAEAAEKLRKVTEIEPGSARAWDSLGLVFDMQGAQDQALQAFRKAVGLNRRQTHPSPWPPHNFGYLLLRMDQSAEAETALRESLRYDPNLAQAHYHLGRVLEKEGRDLEAIAEYASAVSLDISSTDACYSLATLYRKLHRDIDSERMFAEYKKRKKASETGAGK